MITMFMNHLLSWCVNCNMGMCQIYSLENHKWIGHSKRTHSHKLVYNPCNCLDMSTINPTVVLLVLNHSRPTYLTMGAHFATPNFQVLLVFMYRCQLLALVPWCSVIVINVIINGTTRWGWFATITTCWQKKTGIEATTRTKILGMTARDAARGNWSSGVSWYICFGKVWEDKRGKLSNASPLVAIIT